MEEGIYTDSCGDNDKKKTKNIPGFGTQHRHSSEMSYIAKRVSLGLIFSKLQKKDIYGVILANGEPFRKNHVSSQGLFAQMLVTCALTEQLSIIDLRQVHEEMYHHVCYLSLAMPSTFTQMSLFFNDIVLVVAYLRMSHDKKRR